MNLSSPAAVSALLKRHDLHPRKRFGQNFLVDGNTLAKLSLPESWTPGGAALEIGAGAGRFDFGAGGCRYRDRAGRVSGSGHGPAAGAGGDGRKQTAGAGGHGGCAGAGLAGCFWTRTLPRWRQAGGRRQHPLQYHVAAADDTFRAARAISPGLSCWCRRKWRRGLERKPGRRITGRSASLSSTTPKSRPSASSRGASFFRPRRRQRRLCA